MQPDHRGPGEAARKEGGVHSIIVEEVAIVDAQRPLTGRRTQDVPQRKECTSLARVAGTPGPYRPSRATRRNRFVTMYPRSCVALHFMYYNFGRIHSTLRVTPAMEAGISDHVWSMEEIAALTDQFAKAA